MNCKNVFIVQRLKDQWQNGQDKPVTNVDFTLNEVDPSKYDMLVTTKIGDSKDQRSYNIHLQITKRIEIEHSAK